jgi:ABC-type sugar transport system ATPase subunit
VGREEIVTEQPPLLSVQGLSKRFGATQALARVGFEIAPGEVHTLVGENGAGKSTLIKVLGGVHIADEGEIRIDGAPVRFRGPRDAQAVGIVTIPQEMQLVSSSSVADNVLLGTWPRKSVFGILPAVDRTAMRERAAAVLAQLGLECDPDARVGDLAFAERQLVAIARALSLRARILILDEPTASLENREAERLFEVIHALTSDGVAVIYVSHRLDEIVALSDRCTVMRDGRVVSECRRGEIDQETLVRLMTGRDLDELRRSHREEFGSAQLEGHTFAGEVSVRAGEVIGLAGLLGSGTSDLLLSLYGAAPGKGTETKVKGVPVALSRPRKAIASGIGLVPGERRLGLILGMSVRDNIVLPNLDSYMRYGRLDTARMDAVVGELIKALDIRPANPSAKVGDLSGGNQQKVIFARWLAGEVHTLLLDEPTQGIDVAAKARIHHLIRDFVNADGAVVFASSEMVEVMNMSDTVLAMRNGRVVDALKRGTVNYSEGTLRSALGG